jgi:hypothetical protein
VSAADGPSGHEIGQARPSGDEDLAATTAIREAKTFEELVLPIVEVSRDAGVATVTRFRGTGFLVGERGALVTAAHVLRDPSDELTVMHYETDHWEGSSIEAWEAHPSEDVAVTLIPELARKSPLRIVSTTVLLGTEWQLFGFPEETLWDRPEPGIRTGAPDMVYVRGYVRRPMTGRTLPGIRGDHLLEVSAIGGSGVSGSPLLSFALPRWQVIGVYVGERVREHPPAAFGYAASAMGFGSWAPSVFGYSLSDAS